MQEEEEFIWSESQSRTLCHCDRSLIPLGSRTEATRANLKLPETAIDCPISEDRRGV